MLAFHSRATVNQAVIGNLRSRRGRLEITTEILELTSRPTRVTRIVYGCNLNFTIVHKYLDRLIEGGLLRRVPENTAYESTDRGREYFETFYRAQQLLG